MLVEAFCREVLQRKRERKLWLPRWAMSQDQAAIHIFDGMVRNALPFLDQAWRRATRGCSICPPLLFIELPLEPKLYVKNPKYGTPSRKLQPLPVFSLHSRYRVRRGIQGRRCQPIVNWERDLQMTSLHPTIPFAIALWGCILFGALYNTQ